MDLDTDPVGLPGRPREEEATEMEVGGLSAARHQQHYADPFDPNSDRMSIFAQESMQPSERRERRHAALSILANYELLTFHAAVNDDSIPQTRHRLQQNLIGMPSDIQHRYVIEEIPSESQAHHRSTRRTHTLLTDDSERAVMPQSRSRHRAALALGPTNYSTDTEPTIVDVVEINGGWVNSPGNLSRSSSAGSPWASAGNDSPAGSRRPRVGKSKRADRAEYEDKGKGRG
ncbi:hypothetical protein FQN57_003606 [Myotisia sp. PD_48]|nr:hypothetical protein FQN57_003606 [Myotisia sp. PD_48]